MTKGLTWPRWEKVLKGKGTHRDGILYGPEDISDPDLEDSGEMYLVVHAEGKLALPGASLEGTFDLEANIPCSLDCISNF